MCIYLPNTQIQPVKKDIIRHHICYVCHGSSVHLWPYYTLRPTPDHMRQYHLYISYQKLNFINDDNSFWFNKIKETGQ